MVLISSQMVPLGTPAPQFSLPDLAGNTVSLGDFASSPALLVMFLSNHCPYVQHVEQGITETVRKFPTLAVVAICANDAEAYPDDGPDRLREQTERAGWTFPYLIDESQEVAKAYNAACTPDFFLYNAERKLAYRGCLDESSPGNDKPVTGDHLAAAIELVLAGKDVPEPHRPSTGCNVKWRE
jgi:peroxiredoxin